MNGGRTREGSTPAGQWSTELTEVVRAVSGGLLFGVPLLYTMEVWWIGSHTTPEQMFVMLALLFLPLLALNTAAGFRTSRNVGVGQALGDTIEAVAIGLIVSAGVLIMLRRVTVTSVLTSGLGEVLYEAVPFCLGIGVARLLLEGDPGLEEDDEGAQTQPSRSGSGSEGGAPSINQSIADIGATALGAAFIGLAIAPTDEVPMIAASMTPEWQLVIVAASLATSYAVVFVAGFSRQTERRAHRGIFQRPSVETVVTYLVALAVALLLLWVLQREVIPARDLLARVVVLGFPAAVGGAVGRLAL